MAKNKEIIAEGKLNEVIYKKQKRKNGTWRIQQDFEFCPTLCEQHTAHLTDVNYLIEKFKPDELAAYIEARNQYRREIVGHDFTQEPSLLDAHNMIAASKAEFMKLPEHFRNQFRSHLEFIKYVDNEQNAETLLKLGLLSKKQIETIKGNEPPAPPIVTPPATP